MACRCTFSFFTAERSVSKMLQGNGFPQQSPNHILLVRGYRAASQIDLDNFVEEVTASATSMAWKIPVAAVAGTLGGYCLANVATGCNMCGCQLMLVKDAASDLQGSTLKDSVAKPQS